MLRAQQAGLRLRMVCGLPMGGPITLTRSVAELGLACKAGAQLRGSKYARKPAPPRPAAGLGRHARGAQDEDEDEGDDDAASVTSVGTELSVNDVPADRELDRELAEVAAWQQARRAEAEARLAEAAPAGRALASSEPASVASVQQAQQAQQQRQAQQQQQQLDPPAAAERRRQGRGKSVSWAQEQPGPAAPAAAARLGTAAGNSTSALDGPTACLQPPLPEQQQQQGLEAQPAQQLDSAFAMASPFGSPGAAPAGFLEDDSSEGAETADPGAASDAAADAADGPPAVGGSPGEAASRLPLTEETVALLDQQLGSPPGGSPTWREQARERAGLCPPLHAAVGGVVEQRWALMLPAAAGTPSQRPSRCPPSFLGNHSRAGRLPCSCGALGGQTLGTLSCSSIGPPTPYPSHTHLHPPPSLFLLPYSGCKQPRSSWPGNCCRSCQRSCRMERQGGQYVAVPACPKSGCLQMMVVRPLWNRSHHTISGNRPLEAPSLPHIGSPSRRLSLALCLPQGEIVDQLAGAIEEEITQLGGGRVPEDALLQVAKVGRARGAGAGGNGQSSGTREAGQNWMRDSSRRGRPSGGWTLA